MRRLAEGASYRATVGAAARATRSVERAATFVEGGGRARLDAALRAAEQADDRRALLVGRAARDALHFHSARGTVIRGDGEPTER
jgi:hypothetical protein